MNERRNLLKDEIDRQAARDFGVRASSFDGEDLTRWKHNKNDFPDAWNYLQKTSRMEWNVATHFSNAFASDYSTLSWSVSRYAMTKYEPKSEQGMVTDVKVPSHVVDAFEHFQRWCE